MIDYLYNLYLIFLVFLSYFSPWIFLFLLITYTENLKRYIFIGIIPILLLILSYFGLFLKLDFVYTVQYLIIILFIFLQENKNSLFRFLILIFQTLFVLDYLLHFSPIYNIGVLFSTLFILVRNYKSLKEFLVWLTSVILVSILIYFNLDYLQISSIIFPSLYMFKIVDNFFRLQREHRKRYRDLIDKAINFEIQERVSQLNEKLVINNKKLKEIFKLSNYTILPIEAEDIASRVLNSLVELGYTGIAIIIKHKKVDIFQKKGFFPNIDKYKKIDISEYNTVELSKDYLTAFIPLKMENKTIGLICVYKKDKIKPDEIDYLKTYTNAVAIAITKTFYFKEKEELEFSLLQAEKHAVIGKLAAGISHNIKNPLATITSSAFILRKKLKKGDIENSFKLIDRIEKNSKHAEEIINKLLDYAKPTFQNMTELNLKEILKATIDFAKPSLKGKNIKIVDSLEDVYIKGDKNFLQQAFLNILLNSVEAIDKEGEIQVELKKTDDNKAIIKIKDNGKGIPESIKNNIFEPYFTTKPNGTGLGLAIVYKIISEHKGSIHINSKENSGTEFIIEFSTI